MGKTTFSELQARLLTAELAIVTGRFHLQRDAQSGGDKSGLFTLVMRKGADGWRIIHDHTSADN
jgi:ketosteroid isomerase-like protein